MIPLSDDDSARRSFPYVNLLLIALNILAFIYVYALVDEQARDYILNNYSVIPLEVLNGHDLPPPGPDPLWLTLFTAMFLHGGLAHIGFNMLFLFIFGDNVEDAFGHVAYLLFYLFCGIVASLTQSYVSETFQGVMGATTPELGASGAIAGVLGAYLILFPRARVRALVGIGILFFTRLSAALVIGLWFILQFIPAVTALHAGSGVAYFAHVGGFISGAILALIVRPRRLSPPGYLPGY